MKRKVSDKERIRTYLNYRNIGKELNNKILDEAIDNEALSSGAKTLGIEIKGRTIIFDDESDVSVLMNYLIYEHRIRGERVIEWYRDQVGGEMPEERVLLDAMASAKSSLYQVGASEPYRALVHLFDVINEGVVMEVTDINFSQTLWPGALIFLESIELEAFTMTSGIAFPFLSETKEDLLRSWSNPKRSTRGLSLSARRYVTFFQLSKESGAEIRYADLE